MLVISVASIVIGQPYNKNYGCSCKKKERCPLDNKCFTLKIIYAAQITKNTNTEYKKYLGAAVTSFKEVYNNHTQNFKQKECTKYTKF